MVPPGSVSLTALPEDPGPQEAMLREHRQDGFNPNDCSSMPMKQYESWETEKPFCGSECKSAFPEQNSLQVWSVIQVPRCCRAAGTRVLPASAADHPPAHSGTSYKPAFENKNFRALAMVVLWANAWVSVVKAYDITNGDAAKVPAGPWCQYKAGLKHSCTAGQTHTVRQTDIAAPCAAKHSSMGASGPVLPQPQSRRVHVMFLYLHFYDVLSSVPGCSFQLLHTVLQVQRPDGRKGSPTRLCGYWCVNTSSPEASPAALRQKAHPVPQTKVLSSLVAGSKGVHLLLALLLG